MIQIAPGADDALFAAMFLASGLLVGSMLLLGGPLGRSLLPQGHFHFFASVAHLVYHKPAQQMRYLLAVAFALGLACLFAANHLPFSGTVGRSRVGSLLIRGGSLGARVAVVGVAVWAWHSQLHDLTGQPPTIFFSNNELGVAFLLAGILALGARRGAHWLGRSAGTAVRRTASWPNWIWFAVAALATVIWLLPSFFRAQNLAPASLSLTYHLEFTFDDFVALLSGRSPLVNYAEQYASLLPFAAWPVLRLGGANVGTFTGLMCLFSCGALLAVQRTLALVTRSERLALVLYLPFLATSLFFILRSGSQLFSWASYYAVFPMRYLGPYVLLWLCVRHLRGLRPRSAITVYAVGGLTLLNNIEFGLPAFAGALVAMIVSRAEPGWLARSAWRALLGLLIALAIVSVLTLAVGGGLPSPGLWTLYSRIFGEGGYGLLPTPTGGFYLVLYMTFAGALLTAARRYHHDVENRAYTAALAYSGLFGLGTGGYYMGRTNPAGLVVLFSAWALTVVLLAALVMRAIASKSGSTRIPLVLSVSALTCFGLTITSLAQFPAPWTQIQRVSRSATPPAPYDVSAAVTFVRRTTKGGEPVVLLTPLGHLVAFDAGVENVSLYSHPDGVDTYEQLYALLAALRNSGGRKFYVWKGAFPEIPRVLANEGFTPTVNDPASGMTEWLRA